jgi:diacylglycerol kinase (ATP)
VKNNSKGLRHAQKALCDSLNGLAQCFRNEAAFRQECFLGVANMIAAVVLPISWVESVVLILIYLMLPIVELLNTAVEEIVDLVSPQWNEHAKKAKDYASAAVFMVVVLIVAVWCVVLFRAFW